LSLQFRNLGHAVSPMTVRRLLDDSDYGLRANMKSQEPSSHHPERNTQFEYIARKKAEFQEAGLPIISVDTQ
jgi:hypothetical protein